MITLMEVYASFKGRGRKRVRQEILYQIIMPKADLDPNHQTALNSDPVMLPLWHPMG
jgi:aminopeptidase C